MTNVQKTSTGLQTALVGLFGVIICTGNTAVAYPAGTTVSTGSNPIASFSGVLTIDTSGSPTSTELVSIPSDQALILTDISLYTRSNDPQCMDMMEISLATDEGLTGSYNLATRYCYGSNFCSTDGVGMVQRLQSGLRVSPGTTLTLTNTKYHTWTWSGCSGGRNVALQYTISGYYAQP